MKHLIRIVCIILWISLTACSQAPDNETADLFNQVEALKLGRGDYVLGKALTEPQRKIAQDHPVEQPTPGLYKFRDGDLFVVTQKSSDRVLILYEQYDTVTQEKVRNLVGNLFFDFGDPTVLAHDKIIYWVYGADGIMSEEEYYRIKKEKESLKTLATLKLSSSESIMGKKSKMNNKDKVANQPSADQKNISVYYVLSSQRLLEIITSQKN